MENTIEITIDNVAKNGKGIVSNEKWYNFPKNSTMVYEGIKRGDKVSLKLNDDGHVTEYKKTGSAPEKKPFTSGGGFKPKSPEERAEIARSTAVKSVMASPMFTDPGLSDAAKEAMVTLEKFILTGKF